MNKSLNFIIKRLKYLVRSYLIIVCLIVWYFIVNSALSDLSNQRMLVLATMITSMLIYQLGRHYKEENRYDKIKQSMRLLYCEYKGNSNLSVCYDSNKNIDELSFSIYKLRFMNKVIEENLIKDERLNNRVESELKRMIWFNRGWIILAKETLLKNKRMKKRVKEYIEFNHKEIYPNIKETKELVKSYFEKKFNVSL